MTYMNENQTVDALAYLLFVRISFRGDKPELYIILGVGISLHLRIAYCGAGCVCRITCPDGKGPANASIIVLSSYFPHAPLRKKTL